VPQLAAIDGVGDIKAQAFVAGIAAKRALIDKLLANGVTIRTVTGTLVGQTFCCTGFRDAALVAAIEAQGGTMKESAGKGLTYLIALDANGSSGKLQKARQNGTTVIDKAQAFALAGVQ
jgi:NAD-dependent DNA ligase